MGYGQGRFLDGPWIQLCIFIVDRIELESHKLYNIITEVNCR